MKKKKKQDKDLFTDSRTTIEIKFNSQKLTITKG
jgi:hypothetical protein